MIKQPVGNYWLEVESFDGTKVNHSVNLHIAKKKYSIFVQTDKAMYKPGDKVQFRLLVLNSETQPYKSENIEIFVTDGAQNRIKHYENVRLTKGVFKNELQLSDEPVLGTWTIHVKVDGGDEAQKSFEVAEYVLPKFEVIITIKPNVAFNEKTIISFSAEYTYGKKIINGSAMVNVEVVEGWNFLNTAQKFSKQQSLKDSTNVVELDIQKDLNINQIWYQLESKVTVTVKDGLTGREENASATFMIHEKSFQIDIQGSDDNFKPDLPFIITVFGKDLSEVFVNDLENPVNINITYTYDTIEIEPNSTTTQAPYWYWRPPKYAQKVESFAKFFSDGSTSIELVIPENVTSISATVRILIRKTFKAKNLFCRVLTKTAMDTCGLIQDLVKVNNT